MKQVYRKSYLSISEEGKVNVSAECMRVASKHEFLPSSVRSQRAKTLARYWQARNCMYTSVLRKNDFVHFENETDKFIFNFCLFLLISKQLMQPQLRRELRRYAAVIIRNNGVFQFPWFMNRDEVQCKQEQLRWPLKGSQKPAKPTEILDFTYSESDFWDIRFHTEKNTNNFHTYICHSI